MKEKKEYKKIVSKNSRTTQKVLTVPGAGVPERGSRNKYTDTFREIVAKSFSQINENNKQTE